MNKLDRYVAVVLAADRTGHDPVAEQAGTVCKAFAPVGGKPMIIRVLDALADCESIQSVLLCGPPEPLLSACHDLEQRIEDRRIVVREPARSLQDAVPCDRLRRIKWFESADSPSLSAAKALRQVDQNTRILLTTADHALLTPEIVGYFLQASRNLDCDATVGVVRNETIQKKFPGSKRTVIRLSDGNFCGCNLFTFNPHGRGLVSFWQQAEALRKRPWQLINRILGWQAVWAYLFRYLTLESALKSISVKTNIRLSPVVLPFAEAGIDVDKAEDLLLVESILVNSASSQAPL